MSFRSTSVGKSVRGNIYAASHRHNRFYDAETDRRALKSVTVPELRLRELRGEGGTTNAWRKQTPHFYFYFIGLIYTTF